MDKQAAWGRLLADILAGGEPFKRRCMSKRVTTILFAHSSGEGYQPEESVRITGAGHRYLQGLYKSSGQLGSSPAEFREKFFRKKG